MSFLIFSFASLILLLSVILFFLALTTNAFFTRLFPRRLTVFTFVVIVFIYHAVAYE